MSPREQLFALEQFGIKLGLDNITALLDALGHPERAAPVVHVAGTNGKGSVTAMVERGLRAAGHRTGRYTSPHLVHIEERIAIDGRPIDSPTFDEVAGEVLEAAAALKSDGRLLQHPTFFEATTAVAFECFRRSAVDVSVIEVGLGGRWDATNAVRPVVTAITSIAFDHERHLGTTLEAIAFEKAGILKPGVPVVLGPMPQGPRKAIERIAAEVGAPLITAPALCVAEEQNDRDAFALSLSGAHQADNAAVALAVLDRCARAGLSVGPAARATALRETEWPARLEWLRLASGSLVLVDAAHNPAGAAALAGYLRDCSPGIGGTLPCVFGVMRDKNVDAMIAALAPVVSQWHACEVTTPRALPATALAGRLRALHPGSPVTIHGDAGDAIARAIAKAPHAVAAGSIFLVGPLRETLIGDGARPVRYPAEGRRYLLP